ncbi:MAG: DUF72 domain-containing protein [Acidobacteria bacterium]|nr:DUF72 domain-containing protein [Acidobacteriota bacterium]
MKSKTRPIKVGCCGFRTAMAEYTRHFPVVEVQQTFYQPPQISTLERWRVQAPPDFEFTMKAWQLITHEARSPTYKRLKRGLSEEAWAQCGSFRPTAIIEEAWATTLACARALAAGRILFQCPASFTPTREHVDDMHRFFASIERGGGLQFLWEPRGEWADDLVRSLCRELDLTHVVDPFAARTQTPGRCYFRLHGRKGWRYLYDDDELEELLTMLPRDKTSYVLFNNVRMHEDAMRCQELLRLEGVERGG